MDKDHLTIMLITPGSKGPKALNLKISHLKFIFFVFMVFTVASLLSFASTYTFYKDSESKTKSVKNLSSTIDRLSQNLTENLETEADLSFARADAGARAEDLDRDADALRAALVAAGHPEAVSPS